MAELEAKTTPTASSDLPTWMNDPAMLNMLEGLGVDPYEAAPNFNLWFDTVKEIESSGGWNTYNPLSSARGPYQILKGSYPVMLRRTIRAYKKAGVEPPKSFTDALADKDRDPADLSENEVRRLIFLDAQQRPQKNKEGVGTDKLIMDLAKGNWGAGQDLYLDHHHTDRTDQPTLKRSKEKFAEVEDQVVVPFESELKEKLREVRVDAQRVPTEALAKIKVPERAKKILLEDIEVPQRSRVPEETVGPISVPQRGGRFPEIEVDAQRVPEKVLAEIKVPERAKKILLEEIKVPDRELVPTEALSKVKIPERTKKEIPAPYTDYESVLPDLDFSMYRKDGSRKSSSGYLGPQKNKVTGQTMTEYTIGVQIDGKEVEVPSMVPGLTDKELDAIKSGEVLDSVAVKAKAHAEKRIAEGKSPFYQDLEEYTDYESVIDQRLAEVTTPERQLVSEEAVAQAPVKSGEIVIPQEALNKILPSKSEKELTNIVIPKEAIDIRKQLANEEGKRLSELVKQAGEGVTFGLLGELAAAVESATTDKTYDRAKAEYEVAREQFIKNNPELSQIGTAAEFLGTLGTGVALSKGLTKLGIYSLADQGLAEGVVYGLASGEGGEGRVASALLYGGFGNILGRGFDKLLEPSFVGRFRTIEEFNTERARLQEQLAKEARVQRAPTDITDEELATQLLLRDIEYLGDVVGRQGVLPKELPSFYKRMVGYAENMGVDMRQLNKVIRSNKTIKGLRSKLDEPFETLDDMALLRQDLLDMTTGRLLSDVGRTIPAAQDTIVRFRRLASPLATLAEETVGVAFSERLIRAMNRVTRKQADLDNMWKGMEPFRELAETNIKFNDLLLDAVNPRLSLEFKEKSLQAAMNIARSKIGKGAPERLQKFFDDNIEFSKRYRREVTAGDVTSIWMHSSPQTVMRDASLRTYRDKAAIKAEDAASKNVQRPSMKEWREQNAKRPVEKQQEYANIFDSHWTWQRQTLTRMEIGQQLGFRTAGKPIVAKDIKDLMGRSSSKKELREGATPLEATASYEAGHFRLFDDNIIEEALKREGYSALQIKNAQQIIDDIGINANKGMANELEIVRSLGYVGTIANPYGALMNVHDLFNASFELGLGNVISAVFSRNGVRFNPADMGLARQVFGEFVRKARKGTQKEIDALGGVTSGNKFIEGAAKLSEDLLEWSMKWSGFSKLDQFGKSRIMGASFNRARQDIADGSFDAKWQYSFSKPEIDQLKRDIAAGNIDSELVRDLVMFDLFRLQPINAAAQTGAGLANPNARIFYMLKGFAIKQFDLMERRIIKEWQAGNKKQALENLAKYIVISGGGYGVVNEGRQVLKGEVPDAEQAAWSALYQVGSVVTFGAMGANDYGYDKFMNDPLTAAATNLLPPVGASLPGAVIEDIADAFRTGDPLPDETIYALPVVGKTLQGVFKQ